MNRRKRMGGVRRRRSREEISRLAGEYWRSGVSQAEFARRNGVALSTVVAWLRTAREDPAARGGVSGSDAACEFVQVLELRTGEGRRAALGKEGPESGHVFEVELGSAADVLGGSVVRVAAGCDAAGREALVRNATQRRENCRGDRES